MKARSAPLLGQIARFARNFGYTNTLCDMSGRKEKSFGRSIEIPAYTPVLEASGLAA